jgi:hypothetical protein
MQKGCEGLASILSKNPNKVLELLNVILENKNPEARKLIQKLGLTEEKFASMGGGLVWLIVLAVLLYSTNAYYEFVKVDDHHFL